MMTDVLSLVAAFMVGFLGSLHCLGMCGGIVGALSVSASQKTVTFWQQCQKMLAYNAGRILSYTMAGALAGAFGFLVAEASGLKLILTILWAFSGFMMIAMGLYLGQWWLGLTHIERAGQRIWRYIEPLGRRFLPIKKTREALFVGLIWGWLPCGLVYSTLALSVASHSVLQGSLLMAAFGLGTLPSLLLMGTVASRSVKLLQKTRPIFAILMIIYGVWVFSLAISPHHHHTATSSTHDHHKMH